MSGGDSAKVSVLVAVPPADAFEVFTKEIDLWWKHGPKFRIAGRRRGQLHFEGGLGGRLFETFVASRASSATRTVQVGSITAWEPTRRIAFEWRGVSFAPDEKTFVEVRFDPSPSGTLVTVEHRGWSAVRDDHPVRHGKPSDEFLRMMGLWWGELMTSLREHAHERATARGRPRQ